MRSVHPSLFYALLLGCFGLVGCSGGGSTGTVNGTVTLDQEPLKEGMVQFIPVDGKSQTASAQIKDGKFTASVPLHTMKVSFSAPKVLGKPKKMYDTPDSPVVEQVGELIPEKFNVKSTFQITVKAGVQEEKYELTSK
jgi:hypothetical protein